MYNHDDALQMNKNVLTYIKIIFNMNMFWCIICVLLISLQVAGIGEYETMQFKEEVKVENFAFSENQEIMIVLQDYYMRGGRVVNLPNQLYKKIENGYKLFEKNSFSAAKQDYTSTAQTSIGRLQSNNKGNIYITAHSDGVIRVYQIKDSMSLEIQKLNLGTHKPWYVQLSWDGNYLIAKSSLIKIYKWIGDKFEEHSSINTAQYSYVMSHDGQFIFIANRAFVEVYVLEDGKYVSHKVKCPGSKTIPYTQNYKMGASEKQGIYTIIVEQNIYGSFKYQISYFQLNLKAFELNYIQTITVQVSVPILTYLTRNGKYWLYSYKSAEEVFAYAKKNGKYELHHKFWNFKEDPSDIYASEDLSFVAVASKFMIDGESFNKNGPQITFFYKCTAPGCQKCGFSNICRQCKEGYILAENECLLPEDLQKDSGGKSLNQLKVWGSSNNQSYEAKLDADLGMLFLLLLVLFAFAYLLLKFIRRTCEYFGFQCWLISIQSKKKTKNDQVSEREMGVINKGENKENE